MSKYQSYVALGDSFTEGLADLGPDGVTYRGWADRLAEHLSTDRAVAADEAARVKPLRYANLAVRGKIMPQIAAEQVPVAVALKPDLVTVCGGGNDLLRPSGDPDRLATLFEESVQALRAAGADVVLCTGFDPSFPILRRIRGKVATYNGHLRAIADRNGCMVVDLWSMAPLTDARCWSPDRLHLSADGHRRVALRAAEVLGLDVEEDWRDPLPVLDPAIWSAKRREDLQWAREHFLPWVGRRITGKSSGDDVLAKRPDLVDL